MVDVVALAAELLSIDSTSGKEGQIVDHVAGWLLARGWNVTVQEVTRGRGNVWAWRAGHGVTLSTHLDTVPPYFPPRLEGSRLYGRGACDAKGIAAAMLAAAEWLAAEGEERVDLLLLVGEEKGSDGARAANHLPATSHYLVNGEPTESKLATGAKGALRVLLRTSGVEAHSAYPELGRSAITPMLELLREIEAMQLPTDPELGSSTVNIGVIRGGTEANVVPGWCEAELMFRVVGGCDEIEERLDRLVRGRAQVSYQSCIPAQRFHTLPGFETGTVAFTSDVPLLPRWGKPLLFGPGSIHVAHTPGEFVDVVELQQAVRTYRDIVRQLLSS
jgi:acetylornithine deacetylase